MSAGTFYLVIYLLSVFGVRFGLFKLFEKAGENKMHAFIPVVSDLTWLKLIGRPKWWAILCFLPAFRTLVKVQMRIDLAKAFGKQEWWEHFASVIIPFIYFPYIGMQPTPEAPTETAPPPPTTAPRKRGAAAPAAPIVTEKGTRYVGPPASQPVIKRSGGREWADALLYAGSAALIIRTLYFEAFVIPTTSMERTLRAGDFLFVSKYHYGCRLPMVPLAMPFVHNRVPILGIPSYVSGTPLLPYYRLPGLTKVKRNDIVVFNYPAHDVDDTGMNYGKIQEPSMKENYIKRCIGMPGDVMEIKAGDLFINDAPAFQPHEMQYSYAAKTTKGMLSPEQMDKIGFRVYDSKRPDNNADCYIQPQGAYLSCTNEMIQKVKAIPYVDSVQKLLVTPADTTESNIYPTGPGMFAGAYSMKHNNRDNFGPLKIPKAGEAITLTPENYRLYQRCIAVYEGRKFEAKDNKFFIDGKESNTYIPQMDYFFMMGDNRHNSLDSRYWGFVPENHIVGTPVFIFFSTENFFNPMKWRLNRIGTQCIK